MRPTPPGAAPPTPTATLPTPPPTAAPTQGRGPTPTPATATPPAILGTANIVVQQLIGLPGGVSVVLQAAGNTRNYTNLQGDTTTTDKTGVLKFGATTRLVVANFRSLHSFQ